MDQYRLIKNLSESHRKCIFKRQVPDVIISLLQIPGCPGAKAGTPRDQPQGWLWLRGQCVLTWGHRASHFGHLMMQSPGCKTSRGKCYLSEQKSRHFRKLKPKTEKRTCTWSSHTQIRRDHSLLQTGGGYCETCWFGNIKHSGSLQKMEGGNRDFISPSVD